MMLRQLIKNTLGAFTLVFPLLFMIPTLAEETEAAGAKASRVTTAGTTSTGTTSTGTTEESTVKESDGAEPDTEDAELKKEAKTTGIPVSENLKNRDLGAAFRSFRPSEEISADNAVPYPVDI